MKKYIIIFVALLLVLAACSKQSSDVNTPSTSNSGTNKIEITSEGFSPSTLIISSGTTVIFTNKDSVKHWPASAAHPTHLVYPDSGGCIGSKFDACHGLNQGESWTFAFIHKGTWKYHDHLNPKLFGSITVE